MSSIPPCPASLKAIQHTLKIASEHESRDIVIAYWCRLHALEKGLKSSDKKSKEETTFLIGLMEWLETTKKANANNEGISNEICAQSHIEEYVLKLFKYADESDRAGQYSKNLAKAFFTCSIVMDVLTEFEPLSEDMKEKQKYAKVKAAYIFNCIKEGTTPIPGPFLPDAGSSDSNVPETSTKEDTTPISPPTSDHSDPKEPSDASPPVSSSSLAGINFPDLPAPNVNAYMPTPINTPLPNDSEPAAAPFATPVLPREPTSVIKFDKIDVNNLPNVSADRVMKAQKYAKFAASALNFDDVKAAVDNLQKALVLLTTHDGE